MYYIKNVILKFKGFSGLNGGGPRTPIFCTLETSVISQGIVNEELRCVFYRHSHNRRGTSSTLPVKPIVMVLWSLPVTSLRPQDILFYQSLWKALLSAASLLTV